MEPELRRARTRLAFLKGRSNSPTTVTTEDLQKLMKDAVCAYCGDEADEIDHVRPISQGGTNVLSNLVPACRTCNSSKGPKVLTEWDVLKVQHAASNNPNVALELAALIAPG
jgi:5-methylcytosine-specific restriction endonuclease McrA